MGHQNCALDHVFQLSYITRPGITHQQRHCVGRYGGDTLAKILIGILKEFPHHERDAVPALPQRGQLKHEAIQAKEKVAAELARIDLRWQVAIRGGDNSGTDLDGLVAAHAANLATFESSQHLGLQRWKHLTDFVQEQGALRSNFKQAHLVSDCSSESAPDMAKQFRFQQSLSECRAVHGYQRCLRPRALAMNEVDDELFSRAGFAAHENRRVQAGDRRGLPDGIHHFLAAYDEVGFFGELECLCRRTVVVQFAP